jgi:hypothetical protein
LRAVYELVKRNTSAPDHVFDDGYKYSEVCKLKKSVLDSAADVHLYRREKVGLRIDDEGATFGRLNNFLRNRRIVSEREYQDLDWIRRERNKLHVQGLTSSDINYTRAKINRASKIFKNIVLKM